GSLHLNGDGSYRYTPPPDFIGLDSSIIFIEQGVQFQLNITVAVNRGPIIHAPDQIEIAQGKQIAFTGNDALSVSDLNAGSDPVGVTIIWTHGTLLFQGHSFHAGATPRALTASFDVGVQNESWSEAQFAPDA